MDTRIHLHSPLIVLVVSLQNKTSIDTNTNTHSLQTKEHYIMKSYLLFCSRHTQIQTHVLDRSAFHISLVIYRNAPPLFKARRLKYIEVLLCDSCLHVAANKCASVSCVSGTRLFTSVLFWLSRHRVHGRWEEKAEKGRRGAWYGSKECRRGNSWDTTHTDTPHQSHANLANFPLLSAADRAARVHVANYRPHRVPLSTHGTLYTQKNTVDIVVAAASGHETNDDWDGRWYIAIVDLTNDVPVWMQQSQPPPPQQIQRSHSTVRDADRQTDSNHHLTALSALELPDMCHTYLYNII